MRIRASWVRVFVSIALALLLADRAAWSQVATASIYGEVTDPKGLVVTGAKVTLTNPDTGITRTSETDATGMYRFLAMPPGKYRLRTEMSGFRTSVRENVALQVNTTLRLDISLEVGAVTETVSVSATAAPLNTTDASLGNVITGSQIGAIPLEARSIVALLSLQPGAVYLPTGDERSGSISGARSDQSNVTLDGVDVNDPQSQTAAYNSVLRVTLDSVQEFRMTTSNYDATQGRSSAAQVALVTKSGTNELHGSAYWLHRNTATSANEYFLKLAQLQSSQPNKAPKLQKHAFGASLGGPIIKNRFFLFGNFENLRAASETPVTRALPSLSFRDGVLLYQCANSSQCPAATVSGISGTHSIPAGFFGLTPAQLAAIDPLGIGPSVAASNHFKKYPTPNDPGQSGIAGTTTGNIVGLTFASPINNSFWTYIARADFHIDRADKHILFWRGNLQDDVIGGTSQFPGQPPRTKQLVNSKGMAIGYNAILTPRLVNVFRYGLTRISEQTAGLRTSNAVTFRFIDDFDALTSTSGRIAPTHNWADDMTYTHDNHTLQWGANIRRSRIPRSTNAASFHTATANGSWVSGVGRNFIPGRTSCTTPGCSAVPAVATSYQATFADSLIDILGIISQATARYNYNRDGSTLPNGQAVARLYGSNEYEFYMQDSWRIRPNLSVTFGTRYALYSPPFEVNGLQVAPSIRLGEWFRQRGRNAAQGIPSNAIPPFTIDLAGPANGQRGFYDWDYNNWAPRASFAWSPHLSRGFLGKLTGNGKMVIRGGYGIVYDRIGQALALQFDSVGSFGLSTSLSSPFGVNNEDNPAIRFVNLTTLPPSLPAAPPGGFPAKPPSAAGVIQQSIDDTITTPYAHTFDLVIARELPGNLVLESGYVGRRGRSLLIRTDLAMPVNLLDKASGMDYFTAARLAIEATAGITSSAASNFKNIAPIPYFENLFPNTGAWAHRGLTSTQEWARRLWLDDPDYITSLWLFDENIPGNCVTAEPAASVIGARACSKFGPFAYFNDQYDSLAGQSSLAYSDYHAWQVTLRKRSGHGLQFDLNFTLSKSLDLGSGVERGSNFGSFSNGGYTGFLLNPWNSRLHYGQSDFDVRRQINLSWVYELPFGRGRWLGSRIPGWADRVIGGWQIAGLWRMTSGFPFNVQNCRSCWPTNWNLQGNAHLVEPGVFPELATTKNAVGGRPSPFADPVAALKAFRFALPGEVGVRNVLRGDGYFTVDLGVSKTWPMPYLENHRLMFRWETFNLTNTPKFDTGNITALPDRSNFGRYNATLATCDAAAGRCMQFGLRYEF